MTDFLQDHPDGVILALDEMSLYFQATLTHVWSPIGQTPIVTVHPVRERVYFYGALNLRDGREIAMPSYGATAQMSTNFVMSLLMRYPYPILLLLDCARWHSAELTDLIDQTDRLHALYFPPACPQLNPSRTRLGTPP